MTIKTTGVIIARFQTPFLHEGHIQLVNHVKERHNKVVIVLGVSPVKGSTRNPLDYYTRERMVKKIFHDVVVLPLSDFRNDEVWSLNLDSLLSITFPMEKFVLYGGRDSFISYYSGMNEVREIPASGDFNGTGLREQICDQVLDTEDFRRGIIYAYYNRYPTVYPTLDIALFKDDYNFLLLGIRNSEGRWRLPGGFADPSDADYESAALRELREECGMVEVSNLRYERSFKVNDWRYRQETDKIITLMFSCSCIFGEPEGKDDIDEVAWYDLKDIPGMIEQGKIAEEHFPQLAFLLSKYSKVTL